MFNCDVYIFVMIISLFLDFIVNFNKFITLEDGWLKSTKKYKHFNKF